METILTIYNVRVKVAEIIRQMARQFRLDPRPKLPLAEANFKEIQFQFGQLLV